MERCIPNRDNLGVDSSPGWSVRLPHRVDFELDYMMKIGKLKLGRFKTLRLPKRSQQKSITELLIKQLDYSIKAAELAIQVCNPQASAESSRGVMKEIEHQGDFARAALIDRMAIALTTPLDREDLFRASRSIDDVLDTLRDLVREMDLWRVKPGRWSKNALVPAQQSLSLLRLAIAADSIAQSTSFSLQSRKEAGRLRRTYQDGLTGVFSEELTMDTLKKREILRRIDVIGLRLTEAADAILDGLIKRSL